MTLPQEIEALYGSIAWEIDDKEDDEIVAEEVKHELHEALKKAYNGDKTAFNTVIRIVQTYEPFYHLDTEERKAMEILQRRVEEGD